MPIDSNIQDPASGRRAVVSKNNALCVAQEVPDVPGRNILNRYTMYNALLGTAGAVETGITNADMAVDGGTPVDFYIGAEADVDIRIMAVVIVIADTQVRHNTFGNVAQLAVGFDLQIFERGIETSLVAKAQTGGQLIAQSGLYRPYGATTTSFQISNWTGTDDAQTIVHDIAGLVPGGIRIARGSQDKIFATVNDDLTGLAEMTVRVLGYRHHE